MKFAFFRRLRHTRRAVLGLLATVLLLWSLAGLLAPPLLRSLGEKIATEKLGRAVSIGRVEVRPWTLELSLHDLTVAGAEGAAPQLHVERLHMDAALLSLWHRAPVVDALEIDRPTLRLTQQAPGHYDIDDILARLQSGDPNAGPSHSLQFALYNLVLRGGSVDFTDASVQRTHTVRRLELQLPFLSNLPSQRDVKVQPHLSLVLNDSPLNVLADALPFAESRKTEASIHVSGLDVAPYLGYWPAHMRLRLRAGLLDTQLRVAFEHAPHAVLRLSGQLQLRKVRLEQPAPTPQAPPREVLAWDALTVQMDDFQPLARRLHIGSVLLQAPHLQVRRERGGQLDLALAAAPDTAPVTKQRSTPPPAQAQETAAVTGAPGAAAHAGEADWSLVLDRLAVRGAQLDWLDESVPGQAALGLRQLVLDAAGVAWPLRQPVQFSGSADIVGRAAGQELTQALPRKKTAPSIQPPAAARAPARVRFSGSASDHTGQVASVLQDLPLALAAPYAAQWLTPQLAGTLSAEWGLAWQGAAAVAQVARLTVDGLELVCVAPADCAPAAAPGLALRHAASLVELKKLQIEQAQVNLARRSVSVGKLVLTQPRARLERDAQGRWMWERWPVAAVAPPPALPAAPAPWAVRLTDFSLDGGALAFHDRARTSPVSLQVSALRVRLGDFSPLAQAAGPSPLSLSARLGAGRADPGRLEYDGTLGLAPLALQGRVRASQVPLHAFVPYVADALQVHVRRADGSFQGQVQYAQAAAGAQWRVQGDAALDDVQVRMAQAGVQAQPGTPDDADAQAPAAESLAPGEELLHWKTLQLRGAQVAQVPGQPLAVAVRETALSDFFARVILQSTGRLNLQDLLKPPAALAAQAPSGAPATDDAQAAGPASTSAVAAAPVVRMGPLLLTGGRVHFSDYFIQPHYSAQLSELAGRMGAFASVPAAPGGPADIAELELRGRVEGTATLDIVGQLNPLAQPLALDIQAHMRDLELPPLSPYTVKYAGHGVERGKLSMNVAYRVQPDGQLTASNKLVLNQLVFGEPVEGAPASLPVRLAVALLADRQGVIDVELPVSGSLNDPQFRLGPVIFKILGNLIMKAISSPFALLSGALGGGDALDQVAFAPGSAALDAPARRQLDRVAQALRDRPALKMTVVGQADSRAEHAAWKHERLQELLLAHKRRAALRAGQSAAAVSAVDAQEYPALLKALYRRADMAKPRNLVGLAKELPQAEMEALLLAGIAVPDNAMRDLALARGVAVRDYLAQQLSLERLFLGAARTLAAAPAWTPHAELTLGTR